jgi:hypothetical protein
MTHPQPLGWTPAITRNRSALLRIVTTLFFMAGLDGGGADEVPRRVWRRIMRLLRPAESAVRRLIVVAASGLDIEVPKPRPENEGPAPRNEDAARPRAATPRMPAFCLTDPPRRFDTLRWEGLRPFPENGVAPADPDEYVNATGICRRVLALKRALDDLDGHAKRLARHEARRALTSLASKQTQGGYQRHRRPLRLGRPPGHCRRPTQEIDDILRECHTMALNARRLDTS